MNKIAENNQNHLEIKMRLQFAQFDFNYTFIINEKKKCVSFYTSCFIKIISFVMQKQNLIKLYISERMIQYQH